MKKTLKASRENYSVGNFFYHSKCRFCFNNKLKPVINFGYVPLAGGFFAKGSSKSDFDNELYYPLQIYFCPNCYLVQSTNTISGKVLFKDYFYFSSSIKSLIDHFETYSKELSRLFSKPKNRTVLEIGCNDGVLLRPLKRQGYKTIGVDPASNVTKTLKKDGFTIYNNFFTEKLANNIIKKHGKIDVVTGSSSLAHINDMHDVLKGVKTLLKDDGVFIIEEHYLGTLIREMQYDMMYHEHPSYYSLLSLSEFLELFDMHVFKVKYSTLRAGVMRYYAQFSKSGKRKVSPSVKKLFAKEKRQGLHKLDTYKTFYKNIYKTRGDLNRLITKLKKKGKSVVGYGASGRGTMAMSFCGITKDHLDYIVDDAPSKQGSFTPGNHIKIQSSNILDDPKNRPDYAIVFAWPFIDEIRKKKTSYFKSGGKFILPLPEVKIIDK